MTTILTIKNDDHYKTEIKGRNNATYQRIVSTHSTASAGVVPTQETRHDRHVVLSNFRLSGSTCTQLLPPWADVDCSTPPPSVHED